MRKLLKKTASITLAAAMAVSLTACGAGGNGDAKGDGATGKDFVIGGIGPLSGTASSYGNSVKNGAQVAVDEINAAGGINGTKFKLAFEDDQNKTDVAISAYNKLMDDGVNAILGAVTSDPCIALTAETNTDGILQVTPSGSANDCTKYDNGFRICFTDPLQGTTMADYAVKELGKKKIAVMYNVSDPYSTGIQEAFAEQVKSNGGEVVENQSFEKDAVDFKTQLTKIKGSGAELIFIPAYYTEVSYILNQAKKLGMDIPFIGSDGWDGVLKQLGDDTSAAEGAVFLSPFVATDPAENVKKFVEAYQKDYKAVPDQFAADGYDGVYAIAKAYEKAGSMDNDKLVAAMHEITVDGVTGKMTFDENGEPNKAAKMVLIQDGEYTAK